MKRCLPLLLLTLAGLVACGAEPEAPLPGRAWVERHDAGLTVHLADGDTVELAGSPRRIVSLLPGLTETVAMLGALDRLVAVTPHCDRPPEVGDLPRVVALPVDDERLAALAPDLILVDATLHRASLPALRRDFACVLPLGSRSLDELESAVRLLAEVLGTEEARAASRAFGARLGAARARGAALEASAEEPPRVLVLAQTSPPYALGPGALLDDMLRAAGAVNVAADMGRPSGPFSEELILVRQPDWILLLGATLDARVREDWRRVPAVQKDQVVSAGADDLQRAGPRTPDALVRLAEVLHGVRPPRELGDSP